MQKLKITGGNKLSGEIKISGAKNSAVALIPAAILTNTNATILNVPKISDIKYLIEIMELLGCKLNTNNDTIKIDTSNMQYKAIPEELSEMMRASYYFMGAMLAKYKKAEISFPGGCKIGSRPIDLHIKGFKKLGATVTIKKNKYIIEAEELIGNKIYLDFGSVGATINIMLAATKAKGKTIIENAAKEPEIVNIASFLINMGAKINGAGTDIIEIEGVSNLDNGIIEVLPDRIEASTYIILGSLIGEKLKISGIVEEHIDSVLSKLKEAEIKYEIIEDTIVVSACNDIKPVNITTGIYPGFPTDVQQPFTTLLTQANGESKVKETIYESRFLHTVELNKMGAKTNYEKNILKVTGKTKLKGENISATDLRGGASAVIAALIADGTTTISQVDQILRGYENIVEKLKNVGAKIELIK